MKTKATTKMAKGDKATAKPKMKDGGTASKKKYAVGGVANGPGDPLAKKKGSCKMGKCAPGLGPNKPGMLKRIFSKKR